MDLNNLIKCFEMHRSGQSLHLSLRSLQSFLDWLSCVAAFISAVGYRSPCFSLELSSRKALPYFCSYPKISGKDETLTLSRRVCLYFVGFLY